MREARTRVLLAVVAAMAMPAAVVPACSGPRHDGPTARPVPPPTPDASPEHEAPPAPDAELETHPEDEPEPQPEAAPPCPSDMVHVRIRYCQTVERRCAREVRQPDQRRICEQYEPPTRCLAREREDLSFCIDRFEWPNREGAHALGMASWYDAVTSCASIGKRLCWDAEWTAACEGPDELPFPTGWSRDRGACNIDQPSEMARQDRLYSPDETIRRAEVARLDRSHASGTRPGCVSGFGVHDLSGNYDEWVNGESLVGPARWAALKGGSWVRSRNACRPIMSGHTAGFRFHTLSFRCCKDVDGSKRRSPLAWPYPPSMPSASSLVHWPGRVVREP